MYYYEGTYVNQTGKIYIRYLKPIMPHEAKSRDEMHNLVRSIFSQISILLSDLNYDYTILS
jgi:hypothetical protein